MKFMDPHSQQGFSLVSVLVAIGIAGILALVMSHMMVSGINAQRSLELRSDLSALRLAIMRGMDCNKTLPADHTLCNVPTPVYLTIENSLGGVIVANGGAAGTKSGAWYIRTYCSNNTITFEVARVLPGGGFAKDPMTGQPFTWVSLFTGPPICPV